MCYIYLKAVKLHSSTELKHTNPSYHSYINFSFKTTPQQNRHFWTYLLVEFWHELEYSRVHLQHLWMPSHRSYRFYWSIGYWSWSKTHSPQYELSKLLSVFLGSLCSKPYNPVEKKKKLYFIIKSGHRHSSGWHSYEKTQNITNMSSIFCCESETFSSDSHQSLEDMHSERID